MKLYLDCSNTLVFGMFTQQPRPNMPMITAVLLFAETNPDCEVVLWSSGSEKDAAETGALVFPNGFPYATAKKDYETPQDGDYVVDDETDYWRDRRADYPFFNDYVFFTPEEFAQYGL